MSLRTIKGRVGIQNSATHSSEKKRNEHRSKGIPLPKDGGTPEGVAPRSTLTTARRKSIAQERSTGRKAKLRGSLAGTQYDRIPAKGTLREKDQKRTLS